MRQAAVLAAVGLVLDEQSGTVAVTAVRSRVLDDWAVVALLVAPGPAGAVLLSAGTGIGVAALVVRRGAAAVAPPHWSPPPPLT